MEAAAAAAAGTGHAGPPFVQAVNRWLQLADENVTASTSTYYQPEGGIMSGHGVLEDTLSLFMVQVGREGGGEGGREGGRRGIEAKRVHGAGREGAREGGREGGREGRREEISLSSHMLIYICIHYFSSLLCFLQAVIIICVTRLLSLGTKCLKQPRVIMEVVGGILLGRPLGGREGGREEGEEGRSRSPSEGWRSPVHICRSIHLHPLFFPPSLPPSSLRPFCPGAYPWLSRHRLPLAVPWLLGSSGQSRPRPLPLPRGGGA